MSTETPPFAPFQPQTAPSAPAAESAQSNRRGRKPVGEGRSLKEAAQTQRRPRKPREIKTKRAAKYDLQTILKVAGTLKEADQKVFEKMLGELSALPKGGRGRVLKALGEVFG